MIKTVSEVLFALEKRMPVLNWWTRIEICLLNIIWTVFILFFTSFCPVSSGGVEWIFYLSISTSLYFFCLEEGGTGLHSFRLSSPLQKIVRTDPGRNSKCKLSRPYNPKYFQAWSWVSPCLCPHLILMGCCWVLPEAPWHWGERS